MRKLLIKLVAIETALVGWLSYWLFLLYANNPSVATQLSTSLQKFPQLSFSTIDIAVLVIIASLAVTLAFKFQRGLRPGIRLERALQMLENLMKRNLILESQVAELKIEKSHPGTSLPAALPNPQPTVASEEPRAGSWEKAFRTPLEAGPPIGQKASVPSTEETPFSHQTGIPPIRVETKTQSAPSAPQKPTIILSEKAQGRTPPPPLIVPSTDRSGYSTTPVSSSWEDSPKFKGESTGILTPSPAPRKAPAVSESGGLKQPYIPAPAPKMIPNIIVGPMTNPVTPRPSSTTVPPKILPNTAGRSIASPRPGAFSASQTSSLEPAKASSTPEPLFPARSTMEPAISSKDIGHKAEPSEPRKPEPPLGSDEKTRVKDSQPTKKKSSIEDVKN